MTAHAHRALVAIGGFFGGLGGLWSLSEVEPLGIPVEVGAVCSVIAFVAVLAANVIRANYAPAE